MNSVLFQRFFTFFLLFISPVIYAQNRYWVFFKDKEGVSFDPYAFFDKSALERRLLHGLPIDHTDLPVRYEYVAEVALRASKTGYASRWLNALAVQADGSQLKEIRQLPFVRQVLPVGRHNSAFTALDGSSGKLDTELLELEMERLGASVFSERGITGKGIRIAIFDGGFPGVDTNPAFEHLRTQNRIIKTWDFARDKEHVYGHFSHGTMVLSCIAGLLEGKPLGMATDAEFLLAITEVRGEPFSEEENWLEAMEWADRNGAMIINSSLGYTKHRYFPFEMDGNSSLVALAAKMAARKGMLVVNAMGNEGMARWKVLGTPADTDSILSVGGIDPYTGYHISFSSYGPTADGRRKPNVSAPAQAVVIKNKTPGKASGTSFSTPLVTGFSACLWSMYPEWTNMQVLEAVEQSGHLYPYYDYAHGYGTPQAMAFFGEDSLTRDNPIRLTDEDGVIRVLLEEKTLHEPGKSLDPFLYYHIENERGRLTRYGVIHVRSQNPYSYPLSGLPGGHTLRVWYKGYIREFINKTTAYDQ